MPSSSPQAVTCISGTVLATGRIGLSVSGPFSQRSAAISSWFIPPSTSGAGAFDMQQLIGPSNVLVVGDELFMYYTCLKYRGHMPPLVSGRFLRDWAALLG